jgi:hypothetical protein
MQTVLCFADNSASGKSIPFGQRRETCASAPPRGVRTIAEGEGLFK